MLTSLFLNTNLFGVFFVCFFWGGWGVFIYFFIFCCYHFLLFFTLFALLLSLTLYHSFWVSFITLSLSLSLSPSFFFFTITFYLSLLSLCPVTFTHSLCITPSFISLLLSTPSSSSFWVCSMFFFSPPFIYFRVQWHVFCLLLDFYV